MEDGCYVRPELVNDRLHSEQLGLDLVQEGATLRLIDPATGETLPMLKSRGCGRRFENLRKQADKQV